jgi:hypothetical protein
MEHKDTCAAHSGMQEALNDIRRSLARLEEGIIGNGKPGLRDRVLMLEESNRHSEAIRSRNENRVLAAFKVLGPWIISVLAILIGVLYDKQ